MGTIDDFLAGLDEQARPVLQRMVEIAREEVPEASEGTAYGMAALRWRGKPLIGFSTARHHLSLFPFSSGVVEQVRGRLGELDSSKGTIRFSPERAVPDEVVRAIVRLRAAEIDGAGRQA